MRVVLRNPLASDGRDYRHSLSVDREYEVLGIEGESFRLMDDQGEPVLFDAECFEIINVTEPTFWINPFPNETERYAYPPEWAAVGFFEVWHDGDIAVRKAFAEQLTQRYPYA